MTPVAAVATADERARAEEQARAQRCAPSLRRFALLALQIALVLLAFRAYRLHLLVGVGFWHASWLCALGFAVHYWLPLRAKEGFFVALSLGALPFLAGPVAAAGLVALGALVFAIGRADLQPAVRAALLLGVAGIAVAGRLELLPWLPDSLWPLAASVFLFRLPIWAYDRAHMKAPPSLKEFLAYFFMLPNWGCLLFPVIDFQTQRRSFLARDLSDVAQRGVAWMARGVLQLVIFDRLYYWEALSADPFRIESFGALALCIVRIHLLYLRLSGTFHFVIGLLHLFGYDLPETHRKWLLSSSLTDFWRRINVYWKEFMVKLVWFPAYFAWRRGGERRAQLAATALVFVATWFLHAAQTFFMTGTFLWRATDVAFWGILGALVLATLAGELRPGAAARAAKLPAWRRAVRIGATTAVVLLLWSMWNSPGFAEWFELLTWWELDGVAH